MEGRGLKDLEAISAVSVQALESQMFIKLKTYCWFFVMKNACTKCNEMQSFSQRPLPIYGMNVRTSLRKLNTTVQDMDSFQ